MEIFQLIPAASSCDNYQSGRRNKRSSSPMGFSSPNQGIIILPDEKPVKGSGFKDPIEIDEEVEVLGVMKMNKGSSHKNPIIVEQEKPQYFGVCTYLRLHSKRSRSSKKTFMKASWAGKPVFEIGESSGTKFQELLEMEMGDSSSSVSPQPGFICEICTESKYPYELYAIESCSHTYCKSCLNQYVASKVENNMLSIKCPCPDCKKGKLEPAMCSPILENGVFDRWCKALCESMVNDNDKFYCPFKDCSALMINDTDNVIIEAECPHCSRLFCAQCRVPWHAGFSCNEFQKLDKEERQNEDLMLMNLAKMSLWQRCPKCKIYVERIDGCMFMKCRCGFTFCYGCATQMEINHYCVKCKR